jgi:hypothetical protein
MACFTVVLSKLQLDDENHNLDWNWFDASWGSFFCFQLRICHWMRKYMSPVTVFCMSRGPMWANPWPTALYQLGQADRGAQFSHVCSVS